MVESVSVSQVDEIEVFQKAVYVIFCSRTHIFWSVISAAADALVSDRQSLVAWVGVELSLSHRYAVWFSHNASVQLSPLPSPIAAGVQKNDIMTQL